MPGYGIVSGVALKETASARVFEKLVQDIIHVNGKGVDESYVNGSALGSQSIAIPHVKLGAGDFRRLGATVNGGQFNANGTVISDSEYFYVPLLYVYDRTETLAKIMNDKAGYDLLGAKTDNIRKKIARGINALTFAVQIAQTLNDSVGTPLYITESTTTKLYDNYIDANAALDEGDAAIGADYFPTEQGQAFFRPSAFAKMKKDKSVIIDSNLGQEMLATGVLNPFKNSEASKVEMRDGYCGEIDGVGCYKVSPIILSLAATYCQLGGAALTNTEKAAFDKIDAMVCSAVGTIRGFTSTSEIEVVPAQSGQGWVLQPLVHGGCVCISGKSVRLIVASDFTNPATSTKKFTILPPESQSA